MDILVLIILNGTVFKYSQLLLLPWQVKHTGGCWECNVGSILWEGTGERRTVDPWCRMWVGFSLFIHSKEISKLQHYGNMQLNYTKGLHWGAMQVNGMSHACIRVKSWLVCYISIFCLYWLISWGMNMTKVLQNKDLNKDHLFGHQ